jgi:hypothetical protein
MYQGDKSISGREPTPRGAFLAYRPIFFVVFVNTHFGFSGVACVFYMEILP